MDRQFLPPIENVNVQRGFKQFNPEKGGNHQLENSNDFTKFPYTCFGYLHYRDKNTDKKKIIGQAVLIGPSHILTTARNIFDFTKQEDNILNNGEIEFYCGIELDIQTKVIAIYCNRATIKSTKSYDQQDFAMCILEKDIGEKQGFIGMITPLQMAFFEEIQFKQQQVFVFDSQQVLSGQICDVDTKEMLIQFKNQEGEVLNHIDQEINSIQEDSLERELEMKANNEDQEEQEKNRDEIRRDIARNKAQSSPAMIFNKIVFLHDKLFGYAIISTDAQREGLYYKSQFLTNFHLYQMVFWYQGIEVNPKDQVYKSKRTFTFLTNKFNIIYRTQIPSTQLFNFEYFSSLIN